MPDIDGFAVAAHLRQMGDFPIIFLSALSEVEYSAFSTTIGDAFCHRDTCWAARGIPCARGAWSPCGCTCGGCAPRWSQHRTTLVTLSRCVGRATACRSATRRSTTARQLWKKTDPRQHCQSSPASPYVSCPLRPQPYCRATKSTTIAVSAIDWHARPVCDKIRK